MDRRKTGLALAAAGIGALALRSYLKQRRRLDFDGASVLISGGSRGLGLELARRLVDEGAHVAIVARDEAELSRAVRDLRQHGGDVLSIVADVRDREQAFHAVQIVMAEFGGVDALFNVAGVIQAGPHDHMNVADYAESLDIHFWAPLHLMQAVEPYMKGVGRGRIVNVTSIGGLVSIPHVVPYCVGKFAHVALSNGMRAELSRDNIKVTTVCPGLMRTGSHFNAFFKGNHRAEYAWFSIGNALPGASVSSGHAARKIIEACRYGDPFLILGPPAWALHLADSLMPHTMARVMKTIAWMLPNPVGVEGDRLKPGWQSMSRMSPSRLTQRSDVASLHNNELPEPPVELRQRGEVACEVVSVVRQTRQG